MVRESDERQFCHLNLNNFSFSILDDLCIRKFIWTPTCRNKNLSTDISEYIIDRFLLQKYSWICFSLGYFSLKLFEIVNFGKISLKQCDTADTKKDRWTFSKISVGMRYSQLVLCVEELLLYPQQGFPKKDLRPKHKTEQYNVLRISRYFSAYQNFMKAEYF